MFGKFLDEVMQRGDDNIYHVERFVKCNLQVRYNTFFKLIQIHVLFLNTLDQGTIATVYQKLQFLFTTTNILIVNTMII